MPAADGAADPMRVVAWRLGDALLAVVLDAVVEVAAVTDDGAATRAGSVPVLTPPGLDAGPGRRRAIVVRTRAGPRAIPADEVVGVRECGDTDARTPGWLDGLRVDHLRGVVRLDDGRLAALLDADRLESA